MRFTISSMSVVIFRTDIPSSESMKIPFSTSKERNPKTMKKLILTLTIGLLAFTAAHAQQTVVIQRPGVFTDLASAAGAIITLPLAVVEGVVVGTADAAGSLIHGSTEIVVVPPETAVPAATVCVPAPTTSFAPVVVPHAPAVIPTTTIITTHGDGTVTTVTRQVSAYELGPVIITPVAPAHRVGSSPHVNPYVYRPRSM